MSLPNSRTDGGFEQTTEARAAAALERIATSLEHLTTEQSAMARTMERWLAMSEQLTAQMMLRASPTTGAS